LPGLGDGVSLDTDGGMGGVHGGVQQQFGNWVLGVELSGDWGNNNGSASGAWEYDGLAVVDLPPLVSGGWAGAICNALPACNPPARLAGPFGFGEDSVETSMDELFLAVGRVGYSVDNILFFFKGGFASAEISAAGARGGEAGLCITTYGYGNCPDVDAAFPPTESLVSWSATGSTEKRHNGFALGGGFDWMIWKNVSFGVDYTYVNLGSETHSGTLNGDLTFCGECGFDFTKDYKIKVDPDDIHYVNARLTLHFNGSSP
jgi:opacity protein-like surface antigen